MKVVLALIALSPLAPAHAAKVQTGIEVLLADGATQLKGKKVALITHAAAVTSSLESTIDALVRIPDVHLISLLGPEHGVRSAAYAGETIADQRDPKTGVPVFSLMRSSNIYDTASFTITPEMLRGADVLVYDVQDIGARSYTYITTMALAMQAAADAGIPFVVLDRPDPLGGDRVEGNVPPASWKRSFIDWLPIPYVYGMTPGELAQMINGEGWLAGGKRCKLEVVPLRGWKRSMLFADTGLPWVPTSPHIPHADTPIFYVATGILGELRAINEGVGYTVPFEVLGAPWIDAGRFADAMNSLGLPSVRFRAISYIPKYGTLKDKLCRGIQIHLFDARSAPWIAIQFYALETLRKIQPDHLIFKEVAPADRAEFDAVMGSRSIGDRVAAGISTKELLAEWSREDESFLKKREKYLLYQQP